MKKSPRPTDDNVYETPVGGETAPSAAPGTYEIPIGVKSATPTTSRTAGTNSSNSNSSLPRIRVTERPVLPSLSNSGESPRPKPPLPLNVAATPADNASDEYYDHKPLSKPMVTVWWRGQLKLKLNLYLVVGVIIFITLLAIISTIVWIVLLAKKCPTVSQPTNTSTSEPVQNFTASTLIIL